MLKTSLKKSTHKKWNILIAEDDLKIRAQLIKALHPHAACTTVENGAEALVAYEKSVKKKHHFDFVLLDVTMPNLNGFEVLKKIRASEEDEKNASSRPSIIIMVTAYRDSLMEQYNMGWDEFITKPIDTIMLVAKMEQLAASPL